MMFPNWAKQILFLLVYMISGLVLVVIIEGLLTGTELMPLNTVIEQVVVRVRTPFLTTLMVSITRLGNPAILLSVAALVIGLFLVRRRPHDAFLFATALIVAVISLTVLKNTFQIIRPHSEFLDFDGWSFPSGHATTATTFFFMLSYLFFNRMKTLSGKVALILGSVVAAGLIGFSRLYLGAHWALDILAGVALGLLSVSFTVLIFSIFIRDRRLLKDSMSR